jgi:hypothetical protein
MAKKRFWQKVKDTFMAMKRRLKRRRRVATDVPQTATVALPASMAAAIPLPASSMGGALVPVGRGSIEPVVYRAIAIPGTGGPVARRFFRWGRILALVALVVAVVLGIGVARHFLDANAGPGANSGGSTTTTSTATWKMVQREHKNFRWVDGGTPAVMKAKTSADASAAAFAVLNDYKRETITLAGASKLYLGKEVAPRDLVTKDGYASKKAVELASELDAVFRKSTFKVEDAPANGWNTGIDPKQGIPVRADEQGVRGDRTAVRITLPSGKKVWILGRCDNPVFEGKPNLPSGGTDNPPPNNPPHRPPHDNRKSGNARDYKRPGDGNERDSGTGTKPKAVVTTKPEVKPPVVVTQPTPRTVPAPQPGVNPGNGGDNTGKPTKPK